MRRTKKEIVSTPKRPPERDKQAKTMQQTAVSRSKDCKTSEAHIKQTNQQVLKMMKRRFNMKTRKKTRDRKRRGGPSKCTSSETF